MIDQIQVQLFLVELLTGSIVYFLLHHINRNIKSDYLSFYDIDWSVGSGNVSHIHPL